jgi:hypothetical protein
MFESWISHFVQRRSREYGIRMALGEPVCRLDARV